MGSLTKRFSIVEVSGTTDIVLSDATVAALLLTNVDRIYGPSTGSGSARQGFTPGSGGTLTILKPGFGYEVVTKASVTSWDMPGVRVLYGSATSPTTPTLTKLDAPTGTAAANGSTTLNVALSTVAHSSGFRLFSGTSQAGTYTLLSTLSSTTYSNAGLTASQTVWYRAQTVGDGVTYGDSDLSVPFSGTTLAAAVPDPPSWEFGASTRRLALTHVSLASTELEYSHDNGTTYTAYTNEFAVSDAVHTAGEWIARVKAATGRQVSATKPSPSITAVVPAEAPFTIQQAHRVDITGAQMFNLTATAVPITLKVTNASGTIEYNKTGVTLAIRGNSTAGQQKKPGKLALPAKAALLGLLSDDGYNLLAEWFDMTNMRNWFFLNMARALDLIAPKLRFVQLSDDAGNQALYSLTERPKAAIVPNYVKLTATSTDQTGTYIIQKVSDYQEDLSALNSFRTPLIGLAAGYVSVVNSHLDHSISIELPKPSDATASQSAYIKQFTLDAEAALALNWSDPNGGKKYFEVIAFYRHAIFEEFRKDVDTGSQSEYWVKLPGGKLKRMVWDCDASAPYNGLFIPADPSVWWAAHTPWLELAYRSLEFRQGVQNEWVYARSVIVAGMAKLQAQVDALMPVLQDEVATWGVSTATSYSTDRSAGWQGYLDNLAAYKQWMLDRVTNLDRMFAALSSYDINLFLESRYNFHSSRALASIVVDANRRVLQWLDVSPLGEQPLLSDGASAGSPMLNLNVDGYPALELPKNSNGAALHYQSGRTAAANGADNSLGFTLNYYVKLKQSDVVSLANTGFSDLSLSTNGIALYDINSQAVPASTSSSINHEWATVIVSQGLNDGFVMVNGVATINAGGGSFGLAQVLSFFKTGSCYVRHFSSYERPVSQNEATQIHQALLSEFPTAAVAARFATPVVVAESPAQDTNKFLRYALEAGRAAADYAITYDAGDTYVPVPASMVSNGLLDLALPNPFYFPGEVGIKLQSTLATPESLTAYNVNLLGYLNYLVNSNFAQGGVSWNPVNVTIANGVATFDQEGTIFQIIPGNTMRAGYPYKILVTGTGDFNIHKNEDYVGGTPNTDFSLNNETQEFLVGYGDVAHGMSVTITGKSAGATISSVIWTI